MRPLAFVLAVLALMSGARLVVSLLHELGRRGGGFGLATLCVGVGQGQAALFEGS